ncbi:hypothetical protein K438DRAFT_1991354 [Mycena galopus ATCC 62051]|nr:hypothetical protein K438DRAFT_1991354 [Mycena galopus ATCC 62051]
MAPKPVSTSSVSSATEHVTRVSKRTSSTPAQDPPVAPAVPTAATSVLTPITEAAASSPAPAPLPTELTNKVPVSAAIAAAAALLVPAKQVAPDAMPSDAAGATAAITDPPATANSATVVSQGPMIGCSPFLVPVSAPDAISTPITTVPDPTPTYVASTSPSPHRNSFPPLPGPTVEPITSHAQKRKGTKGKGKERSTRPLTIPLPPPMFPSPSPPPTPSPAPGGLLGEGCTSYDEDADLAHGIALSLGHQTDAGAGALSSRRPQDDAAPVSPPKRQHADSSGHMNIPATEERRPQPPPHPRRFAPAFNTRDGNPPRGSFTPTPADPRPVYGITSTVLFQGFTDRQRTQWNAAPGPKAIAYIMGGNGDIMQTTEMMRTAIADRFNIPRDKVLISSPGRAERGPDPIAWLIGGLRQSELEYLLDATFLSSDAISIFFHAFSPPITGFIGTFAGFTILASNTVLAENTIVDYIANDLAITRFVRTKHDAFPPETPADHCLDLWLDSISAEPIELLSPRGGTFTAWNVYVRSPTRHKATFAALQGLFAALVMDTTFSGQGRIHPRALHCVLCLGCNHPLGLCFTRHIPGWLGLTPDTIRAWIVDTCDALAAPAKKFIKGGKRDDKKDGKGKGKGKDTRKGGDRR